MIEIKCKDLGKGILELEDGRIAVVDSNKNQIEFHSRKVGCDIISTDIVEFIYDENDYIIAIIERPLGKTKVDDSHLADNVDDDFKEFMEELSMLASIDVIRRVDEICFKKKVFNLIHEIETTEENLDLTRIQLENLKNTKHPLSFFYYDEAAKDIVSKEDLLDFVTYNLDQIVDEEVEEITVQDQLTSLIAKHKTKLNDLAKLNDEGIWDTEEIYSTKELMVEFIKDLENLQKIVSYLKLTDEDEE